METRHQNMMLNQKVLKDCRCIKECSCGILYLDSQTNIHMSSIEHALNEQIIKEIIEKKKSYTLLAEEMKLKSAPLTDILTYKNENLMTSTTHLNISLKKDVLIKRE